MGVAHRELANCVRALSIDAVEQAKSGHPGMPLGMADAATTLFRDFLKYDAQDPRWPDRDRFVLSNGHGSMLLYSLLYLTGYPKMTIEQIKNFRQLGSITAGHPEYGATPGVEVTTGPLGQGLAAAVGMAIAERRLAAEFGDELVNHHTWVFAGDGCLMEGVGQEAISLAGHLGLNKLILVFDDNQITIDGGTELARSEDIEKKFEACNWRVVHADGHDPDAIAAAFTRSTQEHDPRPVLVNLKTVIGYGAPNKQNTAGVHGAPLGTDELAATKRQLGWEHAPFEIPDILLDAWRAAGLAGQVRRKEWQKRFDQQPAKIKESFMRRMRNEIPEDFAAKSRQFTVELAAKPAKIATRKASQQAIEFCIDQLPELIGGSADLTGSNLTLTDQMEVFNAKQSGRYIHFGVREFAMCAAINGINLHGGLRCYGGTFLVFSDYARNALRLAALMKIPSIFVMTHDSIGLGEDGPTHQPIEHLASLRAIPGLKVFRPADQVETFECWELALRQTDGPSVLALSRQAVEQLRTDTEAENRCASGAYVLKEASAERQITLLATGTEVQIAAQAARKLADDNINAAVVSIPCWELFDRQPAAYRDLVLGTAPRVAIEAASRFGWTRYIDNERDMLGIDEFGVSATGADAYRHFGLTVENLVSLCKAKLDNPAG